MFAKGEQVGPRRLRRRLKAAASVLVAVVAGTFLACQKIVTSAGKDPAEDALKDATNRDVTDVAGEAGGPDSASSDQDVSLDVPDGGGSIPIKAPMVPYDAGRAPLKVDAREHRKGMPVPDNLLE